MSHQEINQSLIINDWNLLFLFVLLLFFTVVFLFFDFMLFWVIMIYTCHVAIFNTVRSHVNQAAFIVFLCLLDSHGHFLPSTLLGKFLGWLACVRLDIFEMYLLRGLELVKLDDSCMMIDQLEFTRTHSLISKGEHNIPNSHLVIYNSQYIDL